MLNNPLEIDLENGSVILLDKPLRWTSFQAVNKLKWLILRHYHLKKVKIGHAGTLDPLATGLLIVCVGKYTKRIEEFQAKEKQYTGTMRLGATTPCFDLEKPIDATYDYSHVTEELLRDIVKRFEGEQLQVPPTFSAVRVDGKRAFSYARQGEDVKILPKPITISSFEVTRVALPDFDFRITCSKGTYIRALARDLGQALNCGAHLTALRRTRIGDFSVEDAWQMDDLVSQFQVRKLPQFCQSCGMPLTKIENCGTNADGSTNVDYCQYCYKDGQFLQECTMDEMIEHCAQFVDEVNKQMPKPMTKEEYKQMMRQYFPNLKRWKH